MNYLRAVDFAAFAAKPGRVSQPLLDATNGATTCSINCIKTPPGEGSPAGMHTHVVDQVFYVLSGLMSLEIAGVQCQAGPGTLVVFPAGVPHRNWNAGTDPTAHLAINVPLPDPAVPFATTIGA
ncbi:MAG: cupin domain-containing protein [Chloroflexota bacterium]|nr:MAG: cupin domain-containing protein [Chloroflexota bacterium]